MYFKALLLQSIHNIHIHLTFQSRSCITPAETDGVIMVIVNLYILLFSQK